MDSSKVSGLRWIVDYRIYDAALTKHLRERNNVIVQKRVDIEDLVKRSKHLYSENMRTPHPFPYQGSKRAIAAEIVSRFPRRVPRIVEPFCGASAISIYSALNGVADRFWLNDLNAPLIELWKAILTDPIHLGNKYEELWNNQLTDEKAFFVSIRDEFNKKHRPEHLLYLLARIVKGAVRYSSDGRFNQSADNRRKGMKPDRMKKGLIEVASLLSASTSLTAMDYHDVLEHIQQDDVVYMDPPYQGTSFTRDHRYLSGVDVKEFARELRKLNQRDIKFAVSYDGSCGPKTYGQELPADLNLTNLRIDAGRSSQATLLGSNWRTTESLYLSPALVEAQALQPEIVQVEFAV